MIPCVNFTFMTSNVTHKIWADGLGGGGSPSSYMKSKHVLSAPRTGGAGGGASFSDGPGAEQIGNAFMERTVRRFRSSSSGAIDRRGS